MHFRGNFKKKLKRPPFHCRRFMCRSKIFVTQQNFLRTLEVHFKIFDKFGKRKKTKVKNQHFRQPVNRKPKFRKLNFSLQIRFCSYYPIFIKPNVLYSGSLKILANKRWFPSNLAKILQGRHVVAGPKNFKPLAYVASLLFRAAFKYCIVESIAIFVCFLLS